MNTDLKLRLIHNSGDSAKHAFTLNASLSGRSLAFDDFYVPNYNKAMLIYKFKSQQDKEAVLDHPDFADLIRRKGFTFHSSNADSYEKESCRTVFVWRLNPLMFTQDDDMTENKEQFKMDLRDHLIDIDCEPHGTNPIQYIHHPEREAPKQLRITFGSKERADKFVALDSRFYGNYLPKKFKKIDTHIPIPQCKTCRKKSHTTGHRDCDGEKRCPRCLTKDHLEPIDDDPRACPPKCWTHNEGHSTGSAICPDNRNYRKQKRNEIKLKTQRENIIQNTDPAYRPLHREVFNIRQDVKTIKASKTIPTSGPSYADAALGRAANMRTPPDFSPPGYAQCFIGAMLMSVYEPDPNAFETIMNIYEERNGWAVCKHPPIRPAFLAALSEQEPAIPEQFIPLTDRAPRLENTPRSSVKRPRFRRTSPESDHSPQGAEALPSPKSSRKDSRPTPDFSPPQPLEPRGIAPPEPSKPTSNKKLEALADDYLSHMELSELPKQPSKAPATHSEQPKSSKDKTSPSNLRQKLSSKKIRETMMATSESPIGLSVQHDANAPSHPGPRKLLKELKWRESKVGIDVFPKISLSELYGHIKHNRVRYTPPVQFMSLTTKVIETLLPEFANELIHFTLEPKNTVTSTTGRVTNVSDSRGPSPERP